MKHYLTILLILGIGITGAKAWDFAEPNRDGDTLYYIIKDNSTVSFDRWMNFPDNLIYEVDTFHLPETVTHNGISYQINYDPSEILVSQRFGYILDATKASPRTLLLPKTYQINGTSSSLLAILQIAGRMNSNRLQNWAIENSKYLTSIDGALYSLDRDTLIAFPPMRTGNFRVPQRVKCITCCAFVATDLDTLILPDKDLELREKTVWQARRMRTFRFPDYITRLSGNVIIADSLREITFGADLKYIGGSELPNTTVLEKVICRAITPPTTGFSDFNCTEKMTLYVPRGSVYEYKRAKGWNSFYSILPIEPPIVTGVDTAEISWVQNFSATGYVWTLYLDKAKTQRFMSLTFDANGHLTNIDIATYPMPPYAPVLYSGDSHEEQRFAEYYSFTISGLSPKTTYYYTRLSLNGTDVIDEESGSFQTLSDKTENYGDVQKHSFQGTKLLRNGQMLIKQGDHIYTSQGQEVTE